MAYTVTKIATKPVEEIHTAIATAWNAASVTTHHETVIVVTGGNAYAWIIYE